MRTQDAPQQWLVCALYQFVRIDEPAALRETLLPQLRAGGIRGTLLLAKEGINGTIAGSPSQVNSFLAYLKQDPRFAAIRHKEALSSRRPFQRTKVKVKDEIVTMGKPNLDPNLTRGAYIQPQDWNALISDPEVLLIDTRNDYEVSLGTFKGAVNPQTKSFRDFPAYADAELSPQKHKKVAMFCTGGIRCEKSTAYLKQQGFDEVYHLEGGILKYLEEVPQEESLWQGECFVFDDRVTVDHQLQPGSYDQCHACRMPISEADKTLASYQLGVSCKHCLGTRTSERQQRLEERQKQIRLAAARGQPHLGGEVQGFQQAQKAKKRAAKARQ